MAKSIYINTSAADPSAAFVASATSATPTALPQFRLGDLETISLYIVDGLGSFDANSGSGSLTVKFGLGNKASEPTGGTFTLTDGTDTTTAIAYNATATAVQTALNALNTSTGPFGDTVTVTGTNPAFKITFDSVGAQTNLTIGDNSLTPKSGIAIAEITAGDGSTQEVQSVYLAQSPVVFQETWGTITDGWQAQVSFATFELRDFLNGAETADIFIEVEITDTNNDRVTRAQAKTVIHGEVIADDALSPVDTPSFYTVTEAQAAFIQNRSLLTGLTGGGSTNLDGIVTASGAAATGWEVGVVLSDVLSVYQLQSGTDAESSPGVIRPDDYAASTNEVIWKLLSISADTDDLETLTTITAAGDTSADVSSYSRKTFLCTVTDTYDATPFTRTISLLTSNAEQGDTIHLRFSMPASIDPTIEVRNATSGGTLLTTIQSENNTDALPFAGTYAYDGTAWNEVSALWVD